MKTGKTDDGVLDNAVWHALKGPQASFVRAEASGRAIRFDPEVSPFGAVERIDPAAWEAQADLVGPEGFAVLFRDEIPAPPPGWKETLRLATLQMVADDLQPAPDLPLVDLDAANVSEMLALIELTEPGPFLARTIEMGRYVGIRSAGRLVAIAGERLKVPGWTEISAVCTHPDAQRQGLAGALTLQLAAAIRERGDEAFLHVVEENEAAIRLYLKLGFRVRRKVEAFAAQWIG